MSGKVPFSNNSPTRTQSTSPLQRSTKAASSWRLASCSVKETLMRGSRRDAARRQHAEHRRFDLLDLVDAADLHQRFAADGVDAERDGVDLDLDHERGQIIVERQAVGVHRDRDAAGLHVRQALAQVRHQQRFAVHVRLDQRMGRRHFLDQALRCLEIHHALDRIDGVVVLRTPHRAHRAAQVALGREIDQHSLRQFGDRKRLPTERRVDPRCFGVIDHGAHFPGAEFRG